MQSGDNLIELGLNRTKKTEIHLFKYLGPAFIISVAYIDPGNIATNISGGSKFNYALIWVILWSNLMSIFLQIMSAKLGIASGHNLPEMCEKVFPQKINLIFGVIAEIGAMATNLAEFLGASLGFNLLFGIPMFLSGFITALLTYLVCYMQKYGQRTIETIIGIFVAVISIAYIVEVFLAKPDWTQVAIHTVIPSLPEKQAVLIAVGMLGATVMPHVIYLHSNLVQYRGQDFSVEGKQKHLRMEKIDIIIAMNMAFLINAAMVVVSAAIFFSSGTVVESMEQAHKSLEPLLGSLSGGIFSIALLASGLSSSAVGTIAGETIMKSFMPFKISANLRRFITMLPAIIIIVLQINPMKALILSQVVLSFILPFPIIQMLIISNRKDLMGAFVNTRIIKFLGIVIATTIILLNAILLYLTFAT